jgi:hypothetical protein
LLKAKAFSEGSPSQLFRIFLPNSATMCKEIILFDCTDQQAKHFLFSVPEKADSFISWKICIDVNSDIFCFQLFKFIGFDDILMKFDAWNTPI